MKINNMKIMNNIRSKISKANYHVVNGLNIGQKMRILEIQYFTLNDIVPVNKSETKFKTMLLDEINDNMELFYIKQGERK